MRLLLALFYSDPTAPLNDKKSQGQINGTIVLHTGAKSYATARQAV
jgi:hypothetical protein